MNPRLKNDEGFLAKVGLLEDERTNGTRRAQGLRPLASRGGGTLRTLHTLGGGSDPPSTWCHTLGGGV